MNQEAIIALALETIPAGTPSAEAAKTICNFLKIATLVGGGDAPVAATSNIRPSRVVEFPAPVEPPPTVCTEEPVARPVRTVQAPVDAQYHTVSEITDYLKEHAPEKMLVTLKDGSKLTLSRAFKTQTFVTGDGGSVKLRYHANNEEEAPCVMFHTGDEKYNLAVKLEEIRKAAPAMYSKEVRTIKPVVPKPQNFEELRHGGGMGGDADEANMDERAMNIFNSTPRSEAEARAWQE